MLHGSTDNGEQDALSAALAAACAAVVDAASGALLSAVPPAMVAATATSVAATASDAAEGTTNLPHTHVAACFSPPLQGDTALPLLSGATAAVLGLGDSNAQVARRQIGPSHLSFFSSFAAFGDDASGPDGPQFHGAESFHDGSAGGGGDSMVVQPGPGGFPAASAELASVDEKPVDAPPRFPSVEDAEMQRTYAVERLAWRARFSEWGVSWEYDGHAEVVELFTRAEDNSPSNVIHFVSAKETCDAATQGVPVAVAQPPCRVRIAHVLTVITTAYAKNGFSLPESVNAHPLALPVGLHGGNSSVVPATEDRCGAPCSPPAHREGKHVSAVDGVENVDVARSRAPKASRPSVAKSAAKVKDVGALEAKGRHGRTMVRMMTAVGIMLHFYIPDAERWLFVHDVFVRMPRDILKGMMEHSIGLMLSSWRWARRGNKGRKERTYDRLHLLALKKPGLTTAADALQYVRKLHAVMISDPFWRYKHVKRATGSVAISWQQWLAEAESWVLTPDADRAGKPHPPRPAHERDAELSALAAEEEKPAASAAGSAVDAVGSE